MPRLPLVTKKKSHGQFAGSGLAPHLQMCCVRPQVSKNGSGCIFEAQCDCFFFFSVTVFIMRASEILFLHFFDVLNE